MLARTTPDARSWMLGADDVASEELHAQPDKFLDDGVETGVISQCIPWGILIVDKDRRILFANQRARTFLTAHCGIEQRGERVHIERAHANRTLVDLIQKLAAACPGSAGISPGDGVVGIPDREGQPHYMLRAAPCNSASAAPAILLIIADLVSPMHVSRSAVARAFHLSEREAELAELFASGLRLEAIAKRMGIAINTARIHLRSTFMKTGCRNQVELARLLAQMP